MELSQEGLTSWGHRYEWNLGGDVTLYRDDSDCNRRLVTHLNARSGLPFEDEYTDDPPSLLSPSEYKEWDDLCCGLLIKEHDIYNRIVDELRRYVSEQATNMRKEAPGKRVISSDEYDLLYHGAQDAIASALSVSDEDIDIINYEGGANIIDTWLGDLLETEGYTLK